MINDIFIFLQNLIKIIQESFSMINDNEYKIYKYSTKKLLAIKIDIEICHHTVISDDLNQNSDIFFFDIH